MLSVKGFADVGHKVRAPSQAGEGSLPIFK